MENVKKRNTGKIILAIVLCAVVIVCAAAAVLFGNIVISMMNIEKITEYPAYTMDYTYDYKLDELLEQGGINNEQELVNYLIKTFLKGVPIPVKYEIPNLGGCSAISVPAADGRKFFGHNHDNRNTPVLMVHTAQKGAYKSVSMVNLSFLGYTDGRVPEEFFEKINAMAAPYFPMDGMNEKGLAVGIMQIFAPLTNQVTDKVDVNTTMMVRIILDKAATVNEAIALFEKYDMHSAAGSNYHFQIADATGDSAVISYDLEKMIVTRSGVSCQTSTNYYLHETSFDYPKFGEDRNETMQTAIKDHGGVMSVEDVRDALSSVKADDKPENGEWNMPTQWSAVYDLTNAKMYLYPGRDYGKAFEYTP